MKMTFSEKHFIIIFSLLFLVSASFLFGHNVRELDPNQGKNWWTLSFANPQDRSSLDFVIENHSTETVFQYQIVSGKKMHQEGTLELPLGESKTITAHVTAGDESRTAIIVTTGIEKKEIYR